MKLPPDFQAQMQSQLKEEYPSFLEAIQGNPALSIRHHPIKSRKEEIQDPVSWYPRGEYLGERPSFTLDPNFHGGAYYVQEASSMFVGYALKQWIDPNTPVVALDLTAAPGGKSTLILENLHPDSLLVANEVIRSRYAILQYNHHKWGYPNVLCTNHDPADFAPLAQSFDLVLVDAPCSGEGLFRKDPAAMEEWSLKAVEHCHLRQKRILQEAIKLVKPGGILLYSTCTYNEKENRESLSILQHGQAWEPLRLNLPSSWNILEQEWGYQFFPHRVRGEGFFFSAFRKVEGIKKVRKNAKAKWPWLRVPKKQNGLFKDWVKDSESLSFFDLGSSIYALPKAIQDKGAPIIEELSRIKPVLEMCQIKKDSLVPSPVLALSQELITDINRIDLSLEEALLFLKGEALPPISGQKGWLLFAYNKLPLGWGKVLPQRTNNYYPKDWRIRMRI